MKPFRILLDPVKHESNKLYTSELYTYHGALQTRRETLNGNHRI